MNATQCWLLWVALLLSGEKGGWKEKEVKSCRRRSRIASVKKSHADAAVATDGWKNDSLDTHLMTSLLDWVRQRMGQKSSPHCPRPILLLCARSNGHRLHWEFQEGTHGQICYHEKYTTDQQTLSSCEIFCLFSFHFFLVCHRRAPLSLQHPHRHSFNWTSRSRWTKTFLSLINIPKSEESSRNWCKYWDGVFAWINKQMFIRIF